MDGGNSIITNKTTLGLINVMMDGDFQFDEEIPLGVGMLASSVRVNGFRVVIHQCLASREDDEIRRASQLEADVYGFQLNIVNFQNVRAVVEKIKARKPEAVIVLGGPFLAALAPSILKNETVFDCIVVGEGELTMVDIMEKIEAAGKKNVDWASIQGILWRDENGYVVHNDQRPLIRDLDILPFPSRDFLKNSTNLDKVDNGILESIRMITSRGCVANCSFCAVNFYSKLQKGKLWRGRSPKDIVDELEYLVDTYGARIINFSDSSFEDPGNKGKIRTREICDLVMERGLKVSAKVYMRCDSMLASDDVDLLKHWKKAGIDVILLGAESGSDLELEFYEKRADVLMNNQTIERLRALDLFYVRVGLIMFGPNSTVDSLRENIDFMKQWDLADNPTHVSNALMLVRDSKLYDILKEQGRVRDGENFWELPKYDWLDEKAKRAARHWDGVEGRYPATNEMNNVQTETENLFSRLTNPMNVEVLEQVEDTLIDIKSRYWSLKKEFNAIQHEYFHRVLDMVDDNCSDEDLVKAEKVFFGGLYPEWLPRYHALFGELLTDVRATDLSLTGLIFRNFSSSMVKEGMERI